MNQQQPHGGPYPLPLPTVVAASPPTSGWAAASLVLGIIGGLGGWCVLGIPCVVAVVAGHIGMHATKEGARGGRGMAVGGLILGYLFVIPWLWLGLAGWMFGAGSPPATAP